MQDDAEHSSVYLLDDITSERTPHVVESLEVGERILFNASQNDIGQRLDALLSSLINGLSRSRIKSLIEEGCAEINGKCETSPKQRIKKEDIFGLVVPPPQDPLPKGENIPLTIVHEDDDLIVIDKPADMVVHPAAGHWSGTLVNALIHYCGDSLSGIGGVKRPGIVHRLDKETSGLLIVAKNDFTHKGLAAQFADHGRQGPLKRAYKALVWNTPPKATGSIETMIGRAPNNRFKMAVVAKDGKQAITHYKVEKTFGRNSNDGTPVVSLITCHLETGRTHQIRVHMTHLGCPLIGDPVYGTGFATKVARLPDLIAEKAKGLKRQALHASLLEIEHPRTAETLHFESALPNDLNELVTCFERNTF